MNAMKRVKRMETGNLKPEMETRRIEEKMMKPPFADVAFPVLGFLFSHFFSRAR